MDNLFGEPYETIPTPQKPNDKERRAWEDAFQRWSDKASQDGTTADGACGYGSICDYCADNSYGRPCVRAINEMSRTTGKVIDYSDRNFERWFNL